MRAKNPMKKVEKSRKNLAEKSESLREIPQKSPKILREQAKAERKNLRENDEIRASENAFEQKRRALAFVENGYKTRVPRETATKIPRAARKIRRKISRQLFARKAILALGWLAWFAVAYFGAQLAMVVLLNPFIWAGILRRDEILHPTDLANALLEAGVYALMLAIFIGIPTWFSRFRARGGGEKIIAKCENLAQKIEKSFGFAEKWRGENAEKSQNSAEKSQKSAESTPKSCAENAQKTQTSARASAHSRENPSGAVHEKPQKIAFRQRIALDRAPRREDFWWFLIGIPDYFLAATIALLSLRLFFPSLAAEPQNIGFHDGASLAVIFVAVVIVPAVAEEILMRGWLFGKLRARWSFAATTILVSAAFAVAHGQLNVGLDTFILSVVLCNIREKTGSIYGTIALHMLKNFVAFGFLYWWK